MQERDEDWIYYPVLFYFVLFLTTPCGYSFGPQCSGYLTGAVFLRYGAYDDDTVQCS